MLGTFLLFLAAVITAADAPPRIVVNGHTLSAPEWEYLRLTRTKGELSPELREQLIEEAIDRQLIRTFLAGRKITAPAGVIDQHVHQLEELVRRRGEMPESLFPKLGLVKDVLRLELSIGPAWDVYIQQALTDRRIEQYYMEHKAELDGTRVRVRQIFRKATADVDRIEAEQLLAKLKKDIEAKRITFEAAAREHSQSPSAEQGGDVGWVGAPGRLPQDVTLAALELKPGQLAGPIKTPLGVHLIEVTDRQAGQLSLEDARPVIIERLSAQLWREAVDRERKTAKITRP